NGSLAHLPAGDAQVTVSADYSRSVSGTHGNGEAIDLGAVSRSIGGASFNTVIPIASAQNGVLPILGQLTVNGMVGVSDVSRYGRLTSSNYGFT
ncbi:TonB-dependent receptor, partial [Staphylococcus aureus]